MKFVKIFLFSSLILLSGCQYFCPKQEIQTKTEFYEKPVLQITRPEPLKLEPVKFLVINKENSTTVLADVEKKQDGNGVVWALSEKDYEALSKNMEELQTFILRQMDVVETYKKYYETPVTK